MSIKYLWLGADNADQDSTASPEITVNSEKNLTDEKGTDTDYLQKVIIISLVLTLIIIPVIVCGVVIYCRRRTKVVGMSSVLNKCALKSSL